MAYGIGSARPWGWRGASLALSGGLLVLLVSSPGEPLSASPDPVGVPIVFTQIPSAGRGEQQPAGARLRGDWGEGGRIATLHPDGRLDVLTEGFAGACDPEISFDGRRILFAGKKRSADPWNIWEMSADGSGVRQVTRASRDCRRPVYLSTLYTITSSEPWYTLLCVGTEDALNEGGSRVSTSLYSARLDGSELRRLTFNLGGDLDPCQLTDGRVVYAGWQHEPGSAGRLRLFDINSDGTDHALFGATQGRRIQHMPCMTGGGLVVFVEADVIRWDGGGQLGCVRIQRPHHSYRPLTSDAKFVYHSPSPLSGGDLLVSRRPAEGRGTHAICRFDPVDGALRQIHDAPDTHDVQAKALEPRREPDGRSSVVNPTRSTGNLYCLNVYDADERLRPHLSRGSVRGLRIVEGLPLGASPRPARANSPRSVPSAWPSGVARRLLGVIPVEADGSFHAEIPADHPIELEALDANGMALATCRWIWAKAGERRGCIGCHEDPELTPENSFVKAAERPSHELTAPPEKRRTVVFRQHILPIIQKKCAHAACHGGDDTPLRMTDEPWGRGPDDAKRAYAALRAPASPQSARRGGVHHLGKYVDPGRARTSYLVWRLFGRNTSRPWDRCGGDALGNTTYERMPPPGKAAPLTEEERRTFVEWIDLGAQEDVPDS